MMLLGSSPLRLPMPKRSHRVLLGLLSWTALLMVGLFLGRQASDSSPGALATTARVLDYATGRLQRFPLEVPTRAVAYGDPIFIQDPKGDWRQAGYVDDVEGEANRSLATIAWYDPDSRPEDCAFVHHRNRGSLAEVVQTLLPKEKRARLARVIAEASAEHGAEIQAKLLPILERSLRDTAPVMEEALLAALRDHQPELQDLGAYYEETFLRQRMAPLMRTELLPLVQEHGAPVARSIGQQLWERASVWRFGWRAVVDSVPLTDRDLVASEFDRYISREALPVVEAHSDQLLEAGKQILVDIAQHPVLREELRRLLGEVGSDPRARKVTASILRAAVIDNEELKAVWVRNWQATEARQALQVAGKRLDQVVRALGDELFGTKATGIHPDFARVLRNQVLGKDRRWIVAQPGAPVESTEARPMRARLARERSSYPLIVMAQPSKP